MTRDARQFWERVPKVDAENAGQKAADDFDHIRKRLDEIRRAEHPGVEHAVVWS